MSHILQDSFDPYGSTAEAAGLWDSLGQGVLSTNSRFGVGQSCRPGSSNLHVSHLKTFNQDAATVFVTFAFGRYNVLPGGGGNFRARLYDGATVQCSWEFTGAGTIEFYRGNGTTLLGTYNGAFSGSATGVWQHFQIKAVMSNTVGSFEVRKNGSLVADFILTGVDNCSTVNEYANRYDILTLASSLDQVFFDDMWIYSGAVVAGEPSDFIGDCRAVQLVPTSDNSVTFSRSAGAANYENVDELINASADYVFAGSAGLLDLYGNPGFVTAPASILCLTARAMVFKTDAGIRTASLRVSSNGITSDRAAVAVGSTIGSITHPVFLDPNTGVAWGAAAVAASLFGPRTVT